MIRTIMFYETSPKALTTKINDFLSKLDKIDYELDTPQFSTLMEFSPSYYVFLTINVIDDADNAYVKAIIDNFQEDL